MSFNWATDSILGVWGKPNGYSPHHAGIDDAKLDELALELSWKKLEIPFWRDPPGIFPEDDWLFLMHGILFNSGNAHYTPVVPPYEKYELPEPAFARGSMGYAAAFTRGLEHYKTPMEWNDAILHITDSKILTAKFFEGRTALPMLEERRQNLNTVARTLREKYRSDPRHIFEEAGWRVFGSMVDGACNTSGKPGVVEILVRDFESVFGDSNIIILNTGVPGRIFFLKRAQLWPMMCYGRACAPGATLPKIKNPEAIGPIVDYVIPNTLRARGVLIYNDMLAKRIDAYDEIPVSSQEEIEIRMAATVALARIVERANLYISRRNFLRDAALETPKITMCEIDYALWSMGRGLKTPHHLTQTLRY